MKTESDIRWLVNHNFAKLNDAWQKRNRADFESYYNYIDCCMSLVLPLRLLDDYLEYVEYMFNDIKAVA